MAENGAAVLVISQDLDEIFEIADRIAVISRGELSAAYPAGEIDRERIGLLMAGAHESGVSGRRERTRLGRTQTAAPTMRTEANGSAHGGERTWIAAQAIGDRAVGAKGTDAAGLGHARGRCPRDARAGCRIPR